MRLDRVRVRVIGLMNEHNRTHIGTIRNTSTRAYVPPLIRLVWTPAACYI